MTDTVYNFALDGYAMSHGDCFLAPFSDRPCSGRMEKAHVIPKQLIRREVIKRRRRDETEDSKDTLWDPRVWRPACYRHHTMLDQSRTLRIPRSAIPVETEEYAAEYGLTWWLDRTFGEREKAA